MLLKSNGSNIENDKNDKYEVLTGRDFDENKRHLSTSLFITSKEMEGDIVRNSDNANIDDIKGENRLEGTLTWSY